MATSSHDVQAWWSHEGQCTGGVGIFVRKAFLEHFLEGRAEWVAVVPGRAAMLRLDGRRGSLDLCILHLPTGAARRQRAKILGTLARASGRERMP